MDLDAKTMRFTGIFCVVTLILSILTNGIKECDFSSLLMPLTNYLVNYGNMWFEFTSNLFLGLFCSGVLVFFVSVITAQNKFISSVNKILYYSKAVKIYFDWLPYCDKSRFLTISKKIVDCFDEFYKSYTEIEFLFFNRRYEKTIRGLFITFSNFVCPFNSVVINNEIKVVMEKEINQYYSESQTLTKVKFHEFIINYVDLYRLWNKELSEFNMEIDDMQQYTLKDDEKKHETIRQILAQRNK